MTDPIPVICDRCRAEGPAGEAPFADLGDLLEFEPVPRRPRADGWTPELQRAFIAALAITGSDGQAARAVGKSPFGVEQLRKAKASEGFNAARERALVIAAEGRGRRLAAGLHAVTAQAAHWRPPEPAWGRAATRYGRPRARAALPPAAPDPAREKAEAEELTRALLRKFWLKVQAEREARIAGRIVEADFYLRQISFFEVAMDLTSEGALDILCRARREGYSVVEVVETHASRLLDFLRRAVWVKHGDPPRPEHPRRDLIVEHDGFATEPTEFIRGGPPESQKEQQRRFDERHMADARAQMEWEAEARRDYERRRATPPLMDEGEHRRPAGGRSRSGGGSAGQPAPEPKATEGQRRQD